MGERRMLAQTVCLSDAFLSMSAEARALYLTLSLLADDDGFIANPKAAERISAVPDGTLDVLAEKRFIIRFPSGVVVIKHWNLNNTLRQDRRKPTAWQDEKAQLMYDENGAYTEAKTGKRKNPPEQKQAAYRSKTNAFRDMESHGTDYDAIFGGKDGTG